MPDNAVALYVTFKQTICDYNCCKWNQHPADQSCHEPHPGDKWQTYHMPSHLWAFFVKKFTYGLRVNFLDDTKIFMP